jgi:hypothetical protein
MFETLYAPRVRNSLDELEDLRIFEGYVPRRICRYEREDMTGQRKLQNEELRHILLFCQSK